MAEAQAGEEREAGDGVTPSGDPVSEPDTPVAEPGDLASEPDGSAAEPGALVSESAVPVSGEGDLVSETLTYLARALVVNVDDVRVEQFLGERGPVYRLRVHPEDMGRVIGKSGRLARSIRQVARAAAARADTTAFIEITG